MTEDNFTLYWKTETHHAKDFTSYILEGKVNGTLATTPLSVAQEKKLQLLIESAMTTGIVKFGKNIVVNKEYIDACKNFIENNYKELKIQDIIITHISRTDHLPVFVPKTFEWKVNRVSALDGNEYSGHGHVTGEFPWGEDENSQDVINAGMNDIIKLYGADTIINEKSVLHFKEYISNNANGSTLSTIDVEELTVNDAPLNYDNNNYVS